MQQRAARMLAGVTMAWLLAGCAGGQESAPEATGTISGTEPGNSPVAITMPEEFLLPLPMGVRAVDLTISGLGRNLAVVREKKEGHIGGLLDPKAIRVMISTAEDRLRVEIQGQSPSPGKAGVIKLPTGVPLRLQMRGGSQSLFVGLTGLEVTALSIADHLGDLYLVLPAEPGTVVQVSGGEGRLTLEVPAGAPAVVQADDGELYRTPGYKAGAGASHVRITGWKGPVKVQGSETAGPLRQVSERPPLLHAKYIRYYLKKGAN